MLSDHAIVEATPRPAACVRLTIPRSEMKASFGPAVGEVFTALRAQGLGPAGSLFAHHLDLSDETFDFCVGFPIDDGAAFVPSGRVVQTTKPGGTMARAIYSGHYEGLPAAWFAFSTWINTQLAAPGKLHGKRRAKHILEVYLTDPAANPDPATWQTELSWPVE